ncbi:MAG TPA: hypothetical protein VF897_04895 [Roseiflexaceae bacterium]
MTSTPTAATLADVIDQLTAPFPSNVIELKRGTTTRNKTRALALAYIDPRAIEDRLDAVVGVEHWICQFEPWGDTGIIARLTILGTTKESTGESDPSDPNCKTSAEAQAFKRAFAKFGFRHLYRLPKLWADYDEPTKGFVNPAAVIIQLYHAVGWDDYIAKETKLEARETARKTGAGDSRNDGTRTNATHATGATSRLPDSDIGVRVQRARQALASAETRTGVASSARSNGSGAKPATERQLAVLRNRQQELVARERFGVPQLENLTSNQASTLIAELPKRTR